MQPLPANMTTKNASGKMAPRNEASNKRLPDNRFDAQQTSTPRGHPRDGVMERHEPERGWRRRRRRRRRRWRFSACRCKPTSAAACRCMPRRADGSACRCMPTSAATLSLYSEASQANACRCMLTNAAACRSMPRQADERDLEERIEEARNPGEDDVAQRARRTRC